MTAMAPATTKPDETPLNRSERLSRDVLHALMIDPQPWAEIQANRREVVRTTFQELDPQDEFEGMLASQMAIAHSIFLGTSWLSLDHERPERDRAHYLRQATRLMTLYRQNFNTLRQWRRERAHSRAGYGARRHLAFRRQVVPAAAAPEPPEKKERGHSTATCHRCAAREGMEIKLRSSAPTPPIGESQTLDFSIPQSRRHRLMETTGLALAQGPLAVMNLDQ